MKLALKTASLGFFNLAQDELNKAHDPEIWQQFTDNIKSVYFPKVIVSPDNELILAEALSKVDFQNDSESAIFLIESNKSSFSYSDFAYYILAKAYIEKKDYKACS